MSTKAGDDEFIKYGINGGFVGGIGYFITLFAYWVIDGFRNLVKSREVKEKK